MSGEGRQLRSPGDGEIADKLALTDDQVHVLHRPGKHGLGAVGLPVHDATSGYRAYRAATLSGIGLHAVRSHGYCF